MRILVVSSQFIKGGLETQLMTYNKYLVKNNKMFYCFQNVSSDYELKNSKVYTDFDFSYNITLETFVNNIDKLVDIIRKEKIDVMHVHPFYCAFSAIIAASVTNIPVVYTYHGFASFNFANNLRNNYLLLYNYLFKNCVNKVLSVSEYGIKTFTENFGVESELYLNGIDKELYKKHKVFNNKKWALISRLDVDKYKEIIKLFDMLPDLDIEEIDIYGSGTEEDKLKEYVIQKNLPVNFMGYDSNISKTLESKEYNGIIGGARVILEGMMMGYPTILIQYSKVVGLLTKDKYNYFKTKNFVDTKYKNISIESFNKELETINIDDLPLKLVENDFDAKVIVMNYEKILKSLIPLDNTKTLRVYNKLKNASHKSETLSNSSVLFQILKEENTDILYFRDLELYELVEMSNINKYLVGEVDRLNKELIKLKEERFSFKEKFKKFLGGKND